MFLIDNRVTSAIIITLVLVIGAVVIGALRLFCFLRPSGHDWEEFLATDFDPGSKECRICGKEG